MGDLGTPRALAGAVPVQGTRTLVLRVGEALRMGDLAGMRLDLVVDPLLIRLPLRIGRPSVRPGPLAAPGEPREDPPFALFLGPRHQRVLRISREPDRGMHRDEGQPPSRRGILNRGCCRAYALVAVDVRALT